MWRDKRDAINTARRTVSGGVPTTFGENFAAAWESFRYESLSVSRRDRLTEEFDKQAELAEQYGVTLPNPYRPRRALDGLEPDPDDTRSEYERYRDRINEATNFDYNMRNFNERIRELRREHPEAGFMTEEEMLRSIGEQAAELRATNEDVAARSTFMGSVGQLAGTFGGAASDPLVLASVPLGASVSTSILRTALIEAGIGAGVEAAIQPQVFGFKQEIDSPYTASEAATNVILAGLGAGVLGGAMRGASELLARTPRGSREVLDEYNRVYRGEEPPPRMPTTEEEDAANLLQRQVEIDEASPFERAPDTDMAHETAFHDSLRQVTEDGVPADVIAPPYQARTGYEATGPARLDPDRIEVDAARFQFKSETDARGVSARLMDVDQWDDRLAGLALVYEQADGRQFIADGHQRLALAQRAKAAGQDVQLNAYVLRELDDVTPEMARAIAATKNIAEGTGTATDAARVLREFGERGLPPLPPRSALVRDARGIAMLGDDAFGAAVNGMVPQQYAAMIGRLVEDPDLQLAVMDVVRRTQPANARQAESIILQAREAGSSVERQVDLFGEQFVTRSLFEERAKVLDRALTMARQERDTFSVLTRRADTIEESGNRLAREANQRRANEHEQIIQNIQRLANSRGPLSDALTDAARRVSDGRSIAAAAEDFLGAIRQSADDGSLARAGTGGRRRADQGDFGETATESRVAQAAEDVAAFQRVNVDDSTRQLEIEALQMDESLEIPWAQRVDDRTGEVVTDTITLRQALDEVAENDRVAAEIARCGRGAAA